MHDGDHEILEGHHEHHDEHRKRRSDQLMKLAAGLIAVGLIVAFILWKLA